MANGLNKNDKNIQFTLEIQIIIKINLLYFTINIFNNTFYFNIYKKPIQTDTITPNGFNHPFSQIVSFFDVLLYILERILLNKFNYKNKFNTICDKGINNNFDIKL